MIFEKLKHTESTTIVRFCFLIIVYLLFFFLSIFHVIDLKSVLMDEVHAIVGWGGYYNSTGIIYGSTSLTGSQTSGEQVTVGNGIYNATKFTTSTGSYFYLHEELPRLVKNHYYSYSQIICSNSNISNFGSNLEFYFNKGSTDNYLYNKNYSVVEITGQANNSTAYNYCYKYQMDFNTKSGTSGTSFILSTRYNNVSSNKAIYIWGTLLLDNGVSNSYLESIAGELDNIINSVGNINNDDVKNKLNDVQNDIINNQNSNNQLIINNNNSNKQEIIDNQNKNTSNQISNENKNHDELMNGDSDSSWTGDSSSKDEYENAENELNSNINVDVSNFNLDLSNWTNVFSWIWNLITQLFNLNPKIFSVVITCLTLGFVGLVVGRK